MRTILIVDDEPSILMLARMALGKAFHVLTAESGEAALALLAAEPVDILVTDQRMPGMSGTDLVRMALERSPGLPCILSTGFAQDQDMLEAVHSLGVSRVAFKPWSPLELKQLIEEVLAELAGP